MAIVLAQVFDIPDLVTTQKLLNSILADFSGKTSKAMVCLEKGFVDATMVMALLEPYRQRLRSTNIFGVLESRNTSAGKGDP